MHFTLADSIFTVSALAWLSLSGKESKAAVPFESWRCKSEEDKLGYQLEKLLLYNHEQPRV